MVHILRLCSTRNKGVVYALLALAQIPQFLSYGLAVLCFILDVLGGFLVLFWHTSAPKARPAYTDIQ